MLNKTKYIIGLSLCGLLLGMQPNVYAQEEQSVQKIERQESTDSQKKVENSSIFSTESNAKTQESQAQRTQETSAAQETFSQESSQQTEQSQAEPIQSSEVLQSRMGTRAVGVAEVANAADFKLALNNPAVSTILFTGNVNMTESLRIPRSLTIDGNGKRLNMGTFDLNANLNGKNQLKIQNMFILTSDLTSMTPMITSDIEDYQMTFDNITYQGARSLINNPKGSVIISGVNDFLKNEVWPDMNLNLNLISAKNLTFAVDSQTAGLKTVVGDKLVLENNAKVNLKVGSPRVSVLSILNPNSQLIVNSGAALDIQYGLRGIYGPKTSVDIKSRGSIKTIKNKKETYEYGSGVGVNNLIVRSGGEFISHHFAGAIIGYGLEIFEGGEAIFEQGSRFDLVMYQSPFGNGDLKNQTASHVYIEETNLDVWKARPSTGYEGAYDTMPDRNYVDLETYFTVTTIPMSTGNRLETETKIHSTSYKDKAAFANEFQMNLLGRISNINYVTMPPALPDPEPELFAQDRTIKVGQVFYPREGVWAKDAAGKDISADITIKNTVNTNVPGNYAVTYKVVTSGKTLTKTVTITVTN